MIPEIIKRLWQRVQGFKIGPHWLALGSLFLIVGIMVGVVADHYFSTARMVEKIQVRTSRLSTDMANLTVQVKETDQRLDRVEHGLGRMAFELESIRRAAVEYIKQQQAEKQQTAIVPKVVKTRPYKRRPQRAAGS